MTDPDRFAYLGALATYDLRLLLADYNRRPCDTDALLFRAAVIREIDSRRDER